MTYIIMCIIAVCGLLLSVLLNRCVTILPTEEPLFTNFTACPHCGGKRSFGRQLFVLPCRDCGTPMPVRHAAVLILSTVLPALVYYYFALLDMPLRAIFTVPLVWLLLIVFFMDLETQLINMPVVGYIAALGAGLTVLDGLSGGEVTWVQHLIGAGALFLPLMLLVILTGERAMGSGDAWLMGACGLLLGVKQGLSALFIGLVLGCIFGVIRKVRTGDSQFAFGPYLAAGVFTSLFVGDLLANGYLRMCGFEV